MTEMASTGGTTKYKPVDLIPLEQMLAPRDTARAATKAKLYAASLDPDAWETKNLLPVAVNRYSGEERLAVPAAAQGVIDRIKLLGQMAAGQSPTGNPIDDYAVMLQTAPQTALDVGLLASGVPAPANSLRMFAGITAKTADREALVLAKEMTKQGVPREEIWKRTGWYKAPDGHWKFEIDDSRAFFRDYAMPKADPFGKDKVVYDYLTKKGYQLEKDPISGGIRNTPANHDAVTPEDMTAAWEYAAANPPAPPETALRNVLTHDELFKAYPELGNIPVSPETSGTVYGSFNGKKITMGGGVINPKVNPLSTTLHEGQHFIEEVENFGRGGNTDFVMRHPDPVVQEAYKRRFDRRFDFAPFDEWRQTYASRLAGKPEDEILRLYELQKNFMEGRKYDPKDQLTIDARRDAAAGTYRDLAGEAEARNTQARMKMSAKERRETPPWMTLDVPERAHITTFETPYGGAKEEPPVRIKLGAKPERTNNTEDFMDALWEQSDEHPFDRRSRILGDTTVEVSPFEDAIHISDIRSLAPKSGAGTAALKRLIEMADMYGVPLEGTAKAYHGDDRYIGSSKRLAQWYKKHGFEILGGSEDDGFDIRYIPGSREE